MLLSLSRRCLAKRPGPDRCYACEPPLLISHFQAAAGLVLGRPGLAFAVYRPCFASRIEPLLPLPQVCPAAVSRPRVVGIGAETAVVESPWLTVNSVFAPPLSTRVTSSDMSEPPRLSCA